MEREGLRERRRISKAERQRKKIIIIGGCGFIVLVLLIAIGVFLFGNREIDYAAADTNTVFVLKDGKIVSTDVEAFDETKYDKDKLQSYLTNIIDTYNAANGEESVLQKSYAVEENVVTSVMEYANAEVYEDINEVELFTGSIEEAQKEGYAFDVSYVKVKDGKVVAAEADDFIRGMDYKVVIIKSNTKVVVPGEICFVSNENVSKVGKDYVIMESGSQLLTEAITEATEVDTEFGTEADGADGSISEDDLESGEGDIIFDFGDEPEVEEEQYTEVLTYIIYK